MRPIALALAGLFTVLAWAEGSAQGYLRGSARAAKDSSEDSVEEEAAPKKRGKKAAPKDEEAAEEDAEEAPVKKKSKKPTDGKGMVEEYLRDRLVIAQKNYHDQKAFGSKMSERWEKFFAEVFDDRKRFETSIARQRLNLFETLSSVGPSYHSQAVGDFERMQTTMLKSFEASQKQKMDEFFGRMLDDVKSYSLEQDRKRVELVDVSMEAWKEQKSLLGEKKEKKD